jgi:hypothetical protein
MAFQDAIASDMLGTFVQTALPACCREEQFAYGRVMAVETYVDEHGTRKWVYVRWMDSDGKPDSEYRKHHVSELEPMREKR